MDELLKNEERAVLELRRLYRAQGYEPFKMSKFEPYSLYVNHKEFLISEGAITFTDTDGTLMALKPDVTLSIVKNYRSSERTVQRVYYNENVYRSAGGGRGYREIMQSGVECLGAVTALELGEVVLLAAQSLQKISPDFVLDLSHLGIISAVLEPMGLSQQCRAEALALLSRKNIDGLTTLIPGEAGASLRALAALSGPLSDVLPSLLPLCTTAEARAAYDLLSSLSRMLEDAGLQRHARLDFSIVNDMNYYNGVVFRGYVAGIPTGVLSGGQYDKLMARMGKDARGVGFAVYLDQLERLTPSAAGCDVDAVLTYGPDADPAEVLRTAKALRETGERVVLAARPDGIRCRRVLEFHSGEVREIG